MTNLDSVLKIRDITLPTKVCLVKAMVSPVVMYGCESWTIKKAEHQRIDAFELWCWRRPLKDPWTANRSNQSILKEISPKYSLEGLMLKLKLQYSGHLMRRTDLFEKTLMLGKIEGRRRRGWRWDGWMASLTQWTWVWVNPGSWWWTGRPGMLQSIESDMTEQLNWTEQSSHTVSDSFLSLSWGEVSSVRWCTIITRPVGESRFTCRGSSWSPLWKLPAFVWHLNFTGHGRCKLGTGHLRRTS